MVYGGGRRCLSLVVPPAIELCPQEDSVVTPMSGAAGIHALNLFFMLANKPDTQAPLGGDIPPSARYPHEGPRRQAGFRPRENTPIFKQSHPFQKEKEQLNIWHLLAGQAPCCA